MVREPIRGEALKAILAERPRFHDDPTNKLERRSLTLSDRVLFYLAEHISAESTTLETGNGLTTLLFSVLAKRHYSISPNALAFERIREYLRQRRWGVAEEAMVFYCAGSEDVLPRESFPLLDLVLIDGNHGFPLPFLDWFYTSRLLRVGGLMVVDDCQLWTGRTLSEFLLHEPEWKLVFEDEGKTRSFQKVAPTVVTKDWYQQGAVKKWSATGMV